PDEPGDDEPDGDGDGNGDGDGWLPTTNDPLGLLVLGLGAVAACSLICLIALGLRRRRRG
ncbi:MAG: hypothetical protein ACI37P_03275, partial [Eggerthellaceae bacterium]